MKTLSEEFKAQMLRDKFKSSVEKFERIERGECTPQDLYNLLEKYAPERLSMLTEEHKQEILGVIATYDTATEKTKGEFNEIEDAIEYYVGIVFAIASSVLGREITSENIKDSDLRPIIEELPLLSLALYKHCPFFFPYIFWGNLHIFESFCDRYDIHIPLFATSRQYIKRVEYYIDFFAGLHTFCERNDISRAELCAMLYDIEPLMMDSTPTYKDGDRHNSAWFIGGSKIDLEKGANTMKWQVNPDTLRGDILVFYETSPVMAINSVWVAEEDAHIDPFGHYFSYTTIGHKVDVPAIPLAQIREDEVLKDFSLVRKSFQGVNGWAMGPREYNRIKELCLANGATIPELFEFTPTRGKDITLEKEVENELIVTALTDMGITNEQYIRQKSIAAGHGRVLPDFSIFPHGEDDMYAKVVIETKRKKDNRLFNTFTQALSYANLQQANLLLIIDERSIFVYERRNGFFSRSAYTQYSTQELENTQSNTFQEIKRLIFNQME